MSLSHKLCKIEECGQADISNMAMTLPTTFLLSPTDGDTSSLYSATGSNAARDSGTDIRFPQEYVIPAGETVRIGLGVRACCLRGLPWGLTARSCRTNDLVSWLTILVYCIGSLLFGLRMFFLLAIIHYLVRTRPMPFMLYTRSSIGKTPLMLANSVGLIDVGYRGELKVQLYNRSSKAYTVRKGDALFQLVAPDAAPATYRLAEPPETRVYFAKTTRGESGFGSTGTQGKQ